MNDDELHAFLDLPEAQANGAGPTDDRHFIWIHNWDKVQSYQRKRDKYWAPPWIKLHTDLWEHEDFVRIPEATRLVLVGLMVAFATTRGRITNDTRTLSRRLHQRVTKTQLELLNHAGFIDFCSGTVREQRWNAFRNRSALEVEVEVEVEKEPPNPRRSGGSKPRVGETKNHVCPDCEIGGGLHAADCPNAQPAPTTIELPA